MYVSQTSYFFLFDFGRLGFFMLMFLKSSYYRQKLHDQESLFPAFGPIIFEVNMIFCLYSQLLFG